MITQILIKVDGTTTVTQGKPSLEDLQAAVGGYIERVPFYDNHNGQKAIAFCNEEGKLKGKPINSVMTALWQGSCRTRDVLVGDIIVLVGPASELEEM